MTTCPTANIGICPGQRHERCHGCPMAVERVMEWQLIETAPKDGSDILCFDAEASSFFVASYQDLDEGLDWWADIVDAEGELHSIRVAPAFWIKLPPEPTE